MLFTTLSGGATRWKVLEQYLFENLARAVQGDSGGPLTVEKDGVHILAGVIRGGAAGNCSKVREEGVEE